MSGSDARPINAVVLDLGGTLVDGRREVDHPFAGTGKRGDNIPVIALRKTFDEYGTPVSEEAVRNALGFSKGHIRKILSRSEVSERFLRTHRRSWTDEDIDNLFHRVRENLSEIITDPALAKPIPGAARAVSELRKTGIKIGCTTGFPGTGADELYRVLSSEHGIRLDFGAHPDLVKSGRPAPWMMYKNMMELNAFPPSSVIKVGDKTSDVLEGKNAGTLTIGIYSTGHSGFADLRDAGADLLAPSIEAIPSMVRQIEELGFPHC